MSLQDSKLHAYTWDSMGPTAGDHRQLASDSIAWVSDQPPSRWHTLLAIGVAACAFLGFLVILPFADARLAHLNALFPRLTPLFSSPIW